MCGFCAKSYNSCSAKNNNIKDLEFEIKKYIYIYHLCPLQVLDISNVDAHLHYNIVQDSC